MLVVSTAEICKFYKITLYLKMLRNCGAFLLHTYIDRLILAYLFVRFLNVFGTADETNAGKEKYASQYAEDDHIF